MIKIKRNLYYIAFLILLVGFAMGMAKIVVTMFDSARKSGQNPVPTVEPSGTTEAVQDTTVVALDDLVVVQEATKVRQNSMEAKPKVRVIGESYDKSDRNCIYVDPDSNIIYFPKASDTIIGRFRRDVVDTLVREPIWERDADAYDGYWWMYWRVRSVKGSVTDMYFINCPGACFCNAGDLDDNGTDEICVLYLGHSNFKYYDVITYRKGEWRMMTESLYANMMAMSDSIEEYVSKSDRPGYIKAKVSRDLSASAEYLDWIGVECVDSFVKIKRDGEVYNGSTQPMPPTFRYSD